MLMPPVGVSAMDKTPDETLKEIYDWMMKQFIEHCAGSPPMKICPDTCHCSCHDWDQSYKEKGV